MKTPLITHEMLNKILFAVGCLALILFCALLLLIMAYGVFSR